LYKNNQAQISKFSPTIPQQTHKIHFPPETLASGNPATNLHFQFMIHGKDIKGKLLHNLKIFLTDYIR
jgi:hypothetical protein